VTRIDGFALQRISQKLLITMTFWSADWPTYNTFTNNHSNWSDFNEKFKVF